MVLKFLLDDLKKFDPYNINPSIIALDEFDLLFTNPGMEDAMLQILRKFGGKKDELFSPFNKKRQFLLSSSTIPNYIQGKSSMDFLNSSFPNLKTTKSKNFDKPSPTLTTNWVDLETLKTSPETLLLKLIKSDLDKNYNTIIFCRTKKICEEISSILFSQEIPNLPYYAGLENTLRLETLHQLYKGK